MSRRGTNIRKRADGRWEGRYYIVDTAPCQKKCILECHIAATDHSYIPVLKEF